MLKHILNRLKLNFKAASIILSGFMAGIAFLIAMSFHPFKIFPWKLRLIENINIHSLAAHFFELNGDESKERLSFIDYTGFPGFEIYNSRNEFIEIIKISGQWINAKPDYLCCDNDHDGFGEVYTITIRNDSIFLNGFEPLGNDGHFLENLFLDSSPKANNNYNINIPEFFTFDTDGDGSNEIVMVIIAGYSLYPRKIYRFTPNNLKLERSQEFGANFVHLELADIDHDGNTEFFFGAHATENFKRRDTIKFNDNDSWLIGINNKLDSVIFELKVPGKVYSSCIIREINDEYVIFHRAYNLRLNTTSLQKINLNGEILDEKIINKRMDLTNTTFPSIFNICLQGNNSFYHLYNENLILIEDNIELGYPVYYKHKDDKKNKPDFLFWQKRGYLIATNNDLSVLSELFIDNLFSTIIDNISILEKTDNDHFVLGLNNSEGILNILEFKINPLYIFRSVFYGIEFLIIFGFFMGVFRLQLYFAQRKMLNDMKISTLQLQSIQNHLHPHFTFNVLNNIAALIRRGENEKGYNYLVVFSDMLRAILTSSDKMNWPLKNEIDFIEAYLKMENLRFNNLFKYSIQINDETLKCNKLPKLMIQGFVENSIKHGLVHKQENCMLEIIVSSDTRSTLIIIEDNGIGREKAANLNRNGAGKGIQIISNFIQAYNLYHNDSFSLEIEDLRNENNDSSGTRVHLMIPLNFE